jgi:hypothetical protein
MNRSAVPGAFAHPTYDWFLGIGRLVAKFILARRAIFNLHVPALDITPAASFDHLVGFRDGEAERLCGLRFYDELELAKCASRRRAGPAAQSSFDLKPRYAGLETTAQV